jgi:hypothetical protein
MAVTTTKTNKPINPRGDDKSPLAFNRAKIYSGKALDFDGVNDNISFTDFEMTSGNKYTLCIYANLDLDGIIWSKDNQWIEVRFLSNVLQLRVYNNGVGSWTIYTLIDNVPANEWHQIIVTYDVDANTWKSYLNGQFIKTLTAVEPSNKIINRIGSSASTFYNGELSNAKIFEVELTAAQVLDLYNNPEKIVPTGVDNTALKLWLPMMEGAGTTAYDGSGNGNHGTISGATWTHGIGAPVAQTAVIDWNKGTNLLPYSERFEQWTQNDSSVSDNVESAPNGTTTADKWVIDSGIQSADIRQTITSSVGQDYLLYLFAKADEFYRFQLDTSNAQFSDVNVDFDVSNGSIVSSGGDNVTQGIIDKGNGWYLCYVVGTAISTSGSFIIRNYNTQTGDGSKGIYLWGGGYVQASDITPYIPTIGATAQTSEVLLPQGLTTDRDITGVNLFENVRKQYALNLDGNSYAEVHDNESLDFGTGEFTMEVWVNGAFVNVGSSFNGILTLGGDAATAPSSSAGIYSRSANYYFAINLNGINFSTIDLDTWTHLVVTRNSSNLISTYYNGVLDTTATYADSVTNALNPQIGRDSNSSRYYQDQIAQPRIYNRALTADEVEQNYNAGKNTYS